MQIRLWPLPRLWLASSRLNVAQCSARFPRIAKSVKEGFMRSHIRIALCSLLVVSIAASGQQSDELKAASSRIAASVLTGPSMETLRELTDGFGGRVTGTSSYQRSAEWAAEKFRAYGIQNVRLEPFPMASGWQRGPARAAILAPVQRAIVVESLGWSPPTAAGGVRGDVVVVGELDGDKIKQNAGKFKGRIVLLDRTKIFAEGYSKVMGKLSRCYQLFTDAGAVAVMFPDRIANNAFNATTGAWSDRIKPLPVAQIGMEDAALIRRYTEKGPVRLELDLQDQVSGPIQVNNVIAELKGTDRPDEWILIGAHLDSWDFGTGAQDNGTGAAAVLEAARVLAAARPRRSVRFALWGGEEQGLFGSTSYARAHVGELGKCVAVLNTDNGSGRPKGWKVEGRKDVQDAMEPISESLLHDLGGELSMAVSYDTDHGPFMLRGVPSLDLLVDLTHYMEVHHQAGDTFDKVDGLDMRAGAAMVAVTAYALAQADRPLAPHLEKPAVEEIIKKAGLDQMLSEVGAWNP
jgi:carboxypeptidase Q